MCVIGVCVRFGCVCVWALCVCVCVAVFRVFACRLCVHVHCSVRLWVVCVSLCACVCLRVCVCVAPWPLFTHSVFLCVFVRAFVFSWRCNQCTAFLSVFFPMHVQTFRTCQWFVSMHVATSAQVLCLSVAPCTFKYFALHTPTAHINGTLTHTHTQTCMNECSATHTHTRTHRHKLA